MLKSGFSAKRFNRKRLASLLVLLLMLLSLCGCGARSASESQLAENTSQADYGSNLAGSVDKTLELKVPEGLEWAATDATTSTPILDRKIIQNADLSLRVKDVSKAVDEIMALNKQSGGYTVSSHIYKKNDRISAELSIKIPQAKLNSTIISISALGEIIDKVIATEDVTEEYYDSEARLKVMKAKEIRLLSLMEKAGSIEDIIKIENELSQTRSEIEVLSGRLKYLTNATDYSQVNISLEQAVGSAVKTPKGTVGKSIQGLINSLNHMINFGSSLIVGLFIILPWVLLVGLLFAGARSLYRRRKAKVNKD